MITDAERYVMEALWDRNPASADALLEVLCAKHDWAPPTVRTLLNRLLQKGAIRAERSGRKFLYSPVSRREDYIEEESQSFLDRVFNGEVSALVSHFSTSQKLSAKDIQALREIIERLENDA